jgi:uncharacterized membrane protein YdbT with pleckstrin-like domain
MPELDDFLHGHVMSVGLIVKVVISWRMLIIMILVSSWLLIIKVVIIRYHSGGSMKLNSRILLLAHMVYL